MRKTLIALSLASATAVALATPSMARDAYHHRHHHVAPVVAGGVVGTAVGVGLYHGWWTSSSFATAASSVAGSAAIGGIAGVGTVALIDAAVQPCKGFHALFGASGCRNGEYVGHRF